MRRPALLATVLAALGVAVLCLGGAGVAMASSLRRKPPSAPPFPCLATATAGWLTAQTSEALLRIEWDGEAGSYSIGPALGPTDFHERPGSQMRELALHVVAPISTSARSSTVDSVSLYAGCGRGGTQWMATTPAPPTSWRECLRPEGETRLECLRRLADERRTAVVDETPGAISDRIMAVSTERGVVLPPPSVHPTRSRHWLGLPHTRWPAPTASPTPGVLDEALDRLFPPEPDAVFAE